MCEFVWIDLRIAQCTLQTLYCLFWNIYIFNQNSTTIIERKMFLFGDASTLTADKNVALTSTSDARLRSSIYPSNVVDRRVSETCFRYLMRDTFSSTIISYSVCSGAHILAYDKVRRCGESSTRASITRWYMLWIRTVYTMHRCADVDEEFNGWCCLFVH
jgi:hypothetical protein